MAKIENIVVFGVGAAGSNVLQHLLYAFPMMNFTVVDDDKVEGRNVDPGTQPYSKMDLNRPKVQAMQRIAMTLKNKKINGLVRRIVDVRDIQTIALNAKTTLIIDAFDNAASRNLFTQLSGDYSVLHIGFSGALTGEAVWDGVFTPMAEAKSDKKIDVCEMTLARPFIFALCSMAAIVIARFIEKDEKVNMYMDANFNMKSWQ